MANKQEHPTNVYAAFEMLLEEVEQEVEFVNNAGSRAFLAGDYARVEEAKAHGVKLTEFRATVADLRQRWQELSKRFDVESDEDEATRAERRNLGRLQRGVRTPEDIFRVPILQTILAMGGSGRVRDVLAQVEASMRGTLTEVDYEPLPSTPNTTRWYNTAQWARNSMAREGLLREDSPRGVWEITESGKQYLKTHSGS